MDTRISRRTARTTGLLYLAMALVGIPGFLVIRPMLFDPDSPTVTLANFVANEGLARTGIGLELALVVVQTLTVLSFYRLFRQLDSLAAGALAVFGTVNAVAVLASAAAQGAALDAALAEDAPGAQLMYSLSGHLWGVAGVFFGLWLIPMGLLALRASMPRPLGWVLLVGGAGYLAGTFVAVLAPTATLAGDLLAYLATAGEFWMIAVLLIHGMRAPRLPAAPVPEAAAQQV